MVASQAPFKMKAAFSPPLTTVFDDDFSAYSAGVLNGQGPWLALGSKHWIVDGSGGVTSITNQLATAQAPASFDPTVFFALQATVMRSVASDSSGLFIVSAGVITTTGLGVRLTWNAGDGVANQVSLVEVVIDGAVIATAGPISWSDSVAHLVTYESSGASSTVLIDGTVIIDSAPGASAGPAATIAIEGESTGVGDVLRLLDVKVLVS